MFFTPQISANRNLILSSICGLLEFYDFIIYALFAGILANAFFPGENKGVSLLYTFATFAVGYLARPIGGIIIGHFGDKYGRKSAFTFSLLIMAVSTFGIALTPTYHQIGFLAPVILLALRILQGFSIGGEIPGSIAFISETLPSKKGFTTGIVFCFLIASIVLGSLVYELLQTLLTKTQLQGFGWRIPFILGGGFGIIGYLFRRNLHETSVFRSIQEKTAKFPVKSLLKHNWTNTLAAIFVTGLGAVEIVLTFLYAPVYLTQVLHIQSKSFTWYKLSAILLSALSCILFGYLSDKFNRKMLLGALTLISSPIMLLVFYIYTHHFHYFVFALLISAALNGFTWGVIPGFLSELFPTQTRYSGVAISYNLAAAIFAGLTPLCVTFIIYKTGLLIAPAIYLVLVNILALIALGFTKTKWLQN